MIYLYGLADASVADLAAALEGYQGLQAPVAVSAAGPWAIVHSEQDAAEILPKRRLMLAHTRVVEQMLTVGPILPARFGLVADDLTQTVALITGRQQQVAAGFARIQGCVEIGLRVSFHRDAVLAATLAADDRLRAERDALRNRGVEAHYAMADFGGRLAERVDRRRGAAQKALLAALTPLARDHLLRAPEEDTEALRAEFLIEKDQLPGFEELAQTTAAKLPFAPGAEPMIKIIGPAPAYNFVQLNLSPQTGEEAA